MKPGNILRAVLCTAGGCCILACSSFHVFTPDHKPGRKEEEPRRAKSDTAAGVSAPAPDIDVDFALAFNDTHQDVPAVAIMPAVTNREARVEFPVAAPAVSGVFREIAVPARTVRVALRRKAPGVEFFAFDTVELCSPSFAPGRRARGRIVIIPKGNRTVSVSVGDEPAGDAALPCTVAATDGQSLVRLGAGRYRGSMVIDGGGRWLSVVNYCDVEDYLRGVVPSELGGYGANAPEALKAQAVAARTYAYKRIATREKEPFDLLRGIEDQVYGGAGGETAETDFAVRATRDLVLVWRDSLADAYYHSTCGGHTANIEDVWDRPPRPYLRSVADTDPEGVAYCSRARKFTWEESWSSVELSKILRVFVGRSLPGERFTGTLRSIQPGERLPCGRLKACRIAGSGGAVDSRGDKLRFILRCDAAGTLLPSANFTVARNGPKRFVLRGNGFGHGVGLCQMGAVGRARQGHSFERILAAYYTGTELRRVRVVK